MNGFFVKKNEFLGESYTRFTHKSGLDVLVFPKKLSTYYAVFATKYGSDDSVFRLAEDRDFTTVPAGIAHYLEHKMFDMPNGKDAFSEFAGYGADANAYTSNTLTAYLFSCTSHFEESLRILLSFVSTPYFTPETVEKERGIIAQEIKMYDDNPYSRLYQTLLECLYEKHPIREDVAGTVDSIAKITPELLYECYRVFYHPSNMMLIVAGDVAPESVEHICDELLPASEALMIVRQDVEESPAAFMEKKVCRMPIAKPLFAIGFKDTMIPSEPIARMKKQATAMIVNRALFGKSGRFYTELYEEGLLSGSFSAAYEIHTSVAFEAILDESRDPEEVLLRLRTYLDTVKKEGIDEEEFLCAKRSLYASFTRIFDSTEDIASYALSFGADGGDLLDFPELLASVTREEADELIGSLFDPAALALSVVEPSEPTNESSPL